MHTIRMKPIEGNLNNNAYYEVSKRSQYSSHSQSDTQSTGSRRAYEAFHGMEPGELTRSSYAKCKQNIQKPPTEFPNQVRSAAMKMDVKHWKEAQSDHLPSNDNKNNVNKDREAKIRSREERLREHKLAQTGSRVLDTQAKVNTSDKAFKKAQKWFYLLPSSHASSKQFSRPGSHQSSFSQQQHLREITGQDDQFKKDRQMFYAGYTPKPGALGSRHFENYQEKHEEQEPLQRKIDSSSSSFKAARKAFFAVELSVSIFYLRINYKI